MEPIAEKLLEIAGKEVGYSELRGGLTKFGDWYAKNIDVDSYFKTAPWCDMFVTWVASKAGLQDAVGEFAGAPSHAKWFKQHAAWGHQPAPGAIVFFDWSGSKDLDTIDHVGIVEKVVKGEIHTIEANVDGGNLKRKVREEGQIVGYGYPWKVLPSANVAAKPAGPPQSAAAAGARPDAAYAPKHAGPKAKPDALSIDGARTVASTKKPTGPENPIGVGQEAVLTGLLAMVVFGSVTLAIGKSKAAAGLPAMPTMPTVRVRKRGKHHRTAVPVASAPVSEADLIVTETEVAMAQADAIEADAIMTVANAVVAQADAAIAEADTVTLKLDPTALTEAADDFGAFWSKIPTLAEDEELAFWDSLHDAVTQAMPAIAEPPAVPELSATW